MTGLFFDPDIIRKTCGGMNIRAKVMFGLLCCERMYPNYLVFHRTDSWGQPQSIRDSLDVVWDWLVGGVCDQALIEGMQSKVASSAPDTENFDSLYVSPALDAANSVEALLQLIIEDNIDYDVEIASLSRDTVDMYVQEIEKMDSSDPNLEEKIRLHPLMQKELSQQIEDIEFLKNNENIFNDINQIRNQRSNPTISNIGLSL